MLDMDVNVGKTDQIFRVVGGMILGALSINALIAKCVPDIYSPIFGAIALIFLATGFSKKCPVNKMLDRSTVEE